MCKIKVQKILNLVESKINYFSNMLGYAEAKTDLIIYIMNLYKKIDFLKFNNENELKYFIYKCLDNERKRLFFKSKKVKECEQVNSYVVDINMNTLSYSDKFHTDMYFFDLISNLSPKQKNIIYYKFYLQLSDVEISNKLNISRQAVNKTKLLALSNLKKVVLS
ncbi:sigma-70 family RNA polymerase sigma factor [Clostridium tarantellae]|uniref:RNA polymerase subunit sigma-24 n=1 Tax=Clostridium tarantellae TaxID=39493 RepID=A0A6I1MKA9_9CLOT|nr:sigma-70 family RNA polymerase sigma factor [Clostridium tarantellae]MPQ43825.1 RNA polymerase subunit sigma-24 [Clostridium tarantellae]